MRRTVVVAVGVVLLLVTGGAIYLTQVGFMGYKPHVDEDGEIQVHEEYEFADENGTYHLEWTENETDDPSFAVEQAIGDSSTETDSTAACLPEDTPLGGDPPRSNITHLNPGAGSDVPMKFRTTYTGTAVVGSPDQEIFIRELEYDPEAEHGRLLLAIRRTDSGPPERDCKQRVRYSVRFETLHLPTELDNGLVPRVYPADTTPDIDLNATVDDHAGAD